MKKHSFVHVYQHAVLYSIRMPKPHTLSPLWKKKEKKNIFSLFWDCGLATTTLQIPRQRGSHGNCFQNTPPHSGREEWIPWALGHRPNPSAHSHILYTASGVEPMTQTGIPALTHKWITSPLLLWAIFFPFLFFILIGVPLFFVFYVALVKKVAACLLAPHNISAKSCSQGNGTPGG